MLRRVVGVAAVLAAACAVWMFAVGRVQSQPPPAPPSKSTPPTGQTYTGVKKCSSCHFKQYTSWKKSKHAKEAWDSVPAKYRATPECLACHATGYGQPTGFKDATSTPNLTGTSCEACHGPGSKHDEIAQKYANKKQLSPDEEKEVRGSIYKVLPDNVCVRCHLQQDHKDHPKYTK